MRRVAMSFLFFMISSVLFGQEQAIAKVHYSFKHVNDTNRRDQPLRDEVVTYLAANSSYYTTYSDVRIKEDISAQKLVQGYDGHLVLRFIGTPTKDFYIIRPNEQYMEHIQAISSSFDVYESQANYEVPVWEIAEDTKEIGGYICQKATTIFQGRSYTAWFTTEIPFPFGPWKLHGLPGLILSAVDESEEVVFDYLGFDKLEREDSLIIETPDYVVKATQEDINRLIKTFEENQGQYYALLQNSGRMALAYDFYGANYGKNTFDFKFPNDYKPSFQTNNPLEKL